MTNWIIGGFVLIAVALSGFFLFGQGEDAMMQDEVMEGDSMQKEEDAMMEKDTMTPKDSKLPTGQVQEDGMMEKDNSIMKDEGAMMSEGETMAAKGSYEVYAPEKLAKANSGAVVLYFRASWCPTCRALDADIRAHQNEIPAGVTILDVDYDTYTALKQKYGVTYQHTFVQVDASGNQITKWSGGQTLASLLANVR